MIKRKKYFWSAALLFFSFNLSGQNLVPNPSFETIVQCPEKGGQIGYAPPWGPAREESTTDLYHTCNQSLHNVSVPENILGYQYPRTGSAYAGIFAIGFRGYPERNYREYLQTKLMRPLEKGKRYFVSFFVSLSGVDAAIKEMGLYLSRVAPIQEDYPEPQPEGYSPSTFSVIQVTPQIKNTTSFLADTIGWMEIKGEYIAEGGEEFITIGNFRDNSAERLTQINDFASYYYVDDVSIYECEKLVDLGPDTLVCKNSEFTLTAYTEGATYEWQDKSTSPFLEIAKEGLYWVNVTKSGCNTQDSIYVSVKDPEFSLGNDITICKGEEVKLKVPISKGSFKWSTNSNSPEINISQQGKYWLTAEISGCLRTDTIEISVEEPFKIELGRDTALCFGEKIVLRTQLLDKNHIWSNGENGPSIQPSETGLYKVKVKGMSCEDEDSIFVKFFDCPGEIPNIITPNGDAANETFIVKEIKEDNWEIEIVNRWGDKVYYSGDYKNDWDARGLSSGIYFYKLFNRNSHKSYKGWLQVLR